MRETLDRGWFGVVVLLAGTALLTGLLAPLRYDVGLLNAGLLFLLLTLVVSARWGWAIGAVAAVVTNLTLNFFFIEPLHTLSVRHPENVIGLAVFLVVSAVAGSLLTTARAAADEARRRAAEARVVLRLSRAMIGQTEPNEALRALCHEAVAALGAPGASVLSREDQGWRVLAEAGDDSSSRPADAEERAIIEQAVASGSMQLLGHTGLGTRRRIRIVRPSGTRRIGERSTGAAFVPLRVGDRVIGVLRLDGPVKASLFQGRPEQLLDAFASEAALGVQRVELVRAAAHAEALRQADEMKSALMTSISHDLKTPLAGIKAAVSSLLDRSVRWSDEDKSAFLETIDSQSDRLDRVISDILDLNRIESGAVAPIIAPVAARDLLEEAEERTATVSAGRLECHAPGDLYLLTDESLLLQALVNLIENAAKYSTPGGAIRLTAAAAGDDVEIIVADEGPGIAARDLPHVFERFYRAGEQSRRVRGSGLGLAIVKAFVGICGGRVRVESAADGTRFVIAMPAAIRAKVTA
ncbi:MAG: ATP-binding protein [Dehalococcoidia bacterium]